MPPDRRADLARVLRFGLVGLLGFAVDTGTLLALVDIGGLPPALAKAASFAVAVLVTFECNRRWAFGGAAPGRWMPTFGTYLGVQAGGFLVNGAVFTLSLLALPPFGARLPAAAALAAGTALVVNFTGARRLVFRTRPKTPERG